MAHGQGVLDCCTRAFADSWAHAEETKPLLAGFIDAMVILEFSPDDEATVVLEGPGFAWLFGGGEADESSNFIFRADRHDRKKLIEACRAATVGGASMHVDVAWSAGSGCHADDENNFFETITSVEHVGSREQSKLLYFAIRDVSDRRSAEHGLARTRVSLALRAIFDEIFLLDLDTGANEPVYAGGRPLVKEDGSPIDCGFHAMFKTVHRDDAQLFWKYSNYLYVERELFGEKPADAITFDLRRHDEAGQYHWTRAYITRLASADARKQVLVCSQNVDEQKEAQRRERELRSKAQLDGLTGAYNHGASEELIRARLSGLRQGESAVFAIIDVDDFKRVNDTYGHATGDELLKLVASVLRVVCREGDIVGRIGGDEFVAFISGGSLPSERRLKSRFELCKEQVRAGSEALGIKPPMTLSIGVTWVSAECESYDEVFNRADKLLYNVKRTGKDAFRFG